MKKKLALVFLSLAVLCSLAACGGKKEEKGTTEAPTKQLETTVKAEETEKAEEAAEKASAKAKEVAGNVKDAVEGTIDGVKNILNKDKE